MFVCRAVILIMQVSRDFSIISYPLVRPQAAAGHQKMELGTPAVCLTDHIGQRRDACVSFFFFANNHREDPDAYKINEK